MNIGEKKPTQVFKRRATREELEMKDKLSKVYLALEEKGLDPIQQIVGYIISEDPAYITSYKNARSLIQKVDRYELLTMLIKNYLDI